VRTSVSVSLPEKLNKEINKIAREMHLTRSDIVKVALTEYLFKYRFRKVRKKMVEKARAKGIYTDEDVFNRLS
jgi:metal-responsive CopG/Arc/MetJ family transcriptional regulator